MTNLETLLPVLASAPKECLYALLNEPAKRVQVFSTSNFLSHVTKLVEELGTPANRLIKEDLNNIKLVILETSFAGPNSRSIKYKQAIQKYKTEGWSFYKEMNAHQWQLKEGYRYKGNTLYYVLSVVSPRRDSIVVGVFDKVKDARDWKERAYPGNVVYNIIVAENEATVNWGK